jgi:hypothetical protein
MTDTTTIENLVRAAVDARSTARAELTRQIASAVVELPVGTILPGVGQILRRRVVLSQWGDGSYPIAGRALVLALDLGGVVVIEDGSFFDGHNQQHYMSGAGPRPTVSELCHARDALPAAIAAAVAAIEADTLALAAGVAV